LLRLEVADEITTGEQVFFYLPAVPGMFYRVAGSGGFTLDPNGCGREFSQGNQEQEEKDWNLDFYRVGLVEMKTSRRTRQSAARRVVRAAVAPSLEILRDVERWPP